MKVDSDGDVEVTIYCFREKPPPPQLYRCGTIGIRARETVNILADRKHFFEGSSGELRLKIQDLSDGDSSELSIPVGPAGSATGGMEMASS